jgi:tetratricopeptide (TPR) repeat protein
MKIDDRSEAERVLEEGREEWDAGNLETARTLFESVVRWAESDDEGDEAMVALAANDLGLTLWEAGELQAAGECLEDSLAATERVYGPTHPEAAVVLNSVGQVYTEKGDLARARSRLERAVAIDRAAYGAESAEVSTPLHNLGQLLRTMGDLDGARSCFELALEAKGGDDQSESAGLTLVGLGGVLRDLHDEVGFRRSFQSALGLLLPIRGEDDELVRHIRRTLDDNEQ